MPEPRKECKLSYELDPTLKDADFLRRHAHDIATEYKRAETERKDTIEKERKKEEATRARERRRMMGQEANMTNVSLIHKIEDDGEWRVDSMPLCEQYFWRLNLTDRKSDPTLTTNDVKKKYRRVAREWHPDKFKPVSPSALDRPLPHFASTHRDGFTTLFTVWDI